MEKYLELNGELKKKKWNMRVMEIPIVVGALGTILRGCEKDLKKLEIKDRPEYWEESWRHEMTWCHSESSETPSANSGVINS